MNRETRIKWESVLMWLVCPIALWAIIIAVALCLFTSCATEKHITEHATHTVTADTLATETLADRHATAVRNYADSLFASLRQQSSASRFSREDNQETVTETITTAIDSLGRELRTEQRTTTRTVSREEQQRMEQTITALRSEFTRRIETYDSLWQQRLSLTQTHWEDSLAALRQQSQQPAATAQPWYKRLWQWLQGFLAAAILLPALWLTRKWWTKLLKH